jgi:hypothetical protein
VQIIQRGIAQVADRLVRQTPIARIGESKEIAAKLVTDWAEIGG